MKVFVTLCALLILSQCDYFAGLQLKQELVEKANLAIEDLKGTLQKYLDCSENRTSVIRVDWSFDSRHSYGFLPNDFQATFKKNKDQQAYHFSYPRPKLVNGHIDMYRENKDLHSKVCTVARYLETIKDQMLLSLIHI